MPSPKKRAGGMRPNAGRPPKGGYTREELAERAERRRTWEAAREFPEALAILDLRATAKKMALDMRAAAKKMVRAASDLETAYNRAKAVLDKATDGRDSRRHK